MGETSHFVSYHILLFLVIKWIKCINLFIVLSHTEYVCIAYTVVRRVEKE